MTKQEHLGLYAEGWTKGDGKAILAATAPTYTFGDPKSGPISREDFPEYFEAFKNAVGQNGDVFMKIDGVITYEVADHLIACCRWGTTGKRIVGTGLIVVGPNGVLREDIAILQG